MIVALPGLFSYLFLVLVVLCWALLLFGVGFLHVLSYSLYYCCVKRILSSILIALLVIRELVVLFFFGLWLVYCLLWFVCSSSWCHWSVIVAISRLRVTTTSDNVSQRKRNPLAEP